MLMACQSYARLRLRFYSHYFRGENHTLRRAVFVPGIFYASGMPVVLSAIALAKAEAEGIIL